MNSRTLYVKSSSHHFEILFLLTGFLILGWRCNTPSAAKRDLRHINHACDVSNTAHQEQSQSTEKLQSTTLLTDSDELKIGNVILICDLRENQRIPVLATWLLSVLTVLKKKMEADDRPETPYFRLPVVTFVLPMIYVFHLRIANSWLFSHLQQRQYSTPWVCFFFANTIHNSAHTYTDRLIRALSQNQSTWLGISHSSVPCLSPLWLRWPDTETIPAGRWTMMTDEYLQATIKVLFHHHRLNLGDGHTRTHPTTPTTPTDARISLALHSSFNLSRWGCERDANVRARVVAFVYRRLDVTSWRVNICDESISGCDRGKD